MSYKSGRVGRVHVLHWVTAPQLQDVLKLRSEIAAERAAAGELLINLSLVASGVTGPEPDAREAMKKVNADFAKHCEGIHVVIAGAGFKPAIIRSVISALAFALEKRGFVTVHDSTSEAIGDIAAKLRMDREALFRRIKLLDVLD